LDPGDGRRVVAEGGEGTLAAVGKVSDQVLVAEDASEFQVRVGNGAVGICKADQVILNAPGKRFSPD
jgi:hypothetical protein